MSFLDEASEVCGFCELVIQIGYKNLNERDYKTMQGHLRLAHGLQPFEISC